MYHVEEFLEGADIELLVGERIPAHAFNDTDLARSMDAIFEAGPSRILTELGIRASGEFRLDGNSSDKTSNNEMLSGIGSLMARHGLGPGAFVHVADSALVTEPNLESVGPNRFVTRLPANYSECSRAIVQAVGAGKREDLGTLAETPAGAKRPNAAYKASETQVVLYGKSYRALVVHSSAHDKRRRRRL